MSKLALELKNISKSFGAVRANNCVSIAIKQGSIHGIVGENGAGKSTLMSIIYGFYQADQGQILVKNSTATIRNSQQAIALGIGMVHQHFMLIETFTVLDNILLGAEGGLVLKQGRAAARKQLQALSQQFQLAIDLDALVQDLPVGLQQRVEILKALYRQVDILILDEPTGVLTPSETVQLFGILRALNKQGTSIVLITHKLKEIMAITDRVSVMRAGQMVAHLDTAQTNEAKLAELMVGRKVLLGGHNPSHQIGGSALTVQNLHYQDAAGVARLKDISFSLQYGEILAVAGVSGNGQSELLSCLAGLLAAQSGQIIFKNQPLQLGAPIREIGMAFVPEDRHKQGLINKMPAAEAYILGYQRQKEYRKWGVLQHNRIRKQCQADMDKWDVRPNNPDLLTANFSGGNQQKLILAREVEKDPEVLLIGQPTRGVDIGAIEFIHQQLIALRDQGKGILLVSAELDEILTLADRIMVMVDGKIVGIVPRQSTNETELGLMMANAQTSARTKEAS